MNILFDVGHPAHVHLFACTAHELEKRGDKVLFTIRDRAMIPELLEANGFNYKIASIPRTGTVGRVFELVEHDWNVLKEAISFKPDFMMGTSVAIAHASRILKGKSIVFCEDDADYMSPFAQLTYPFADTIAIPSVLRDKRTKRHLTYESYHELAYLHPDRFTPDPTIYDELGIKRGEDFFILRLVAFKAFHDVGRGGVNHDSQIKLVKLLTRYGKVFITNEGILADELQQYQLPIPPHRIHHALNYAKMVISDGATTAIEAAVLGTPTILLNTFVDISSVVQDVEKYQIMYCYKPGQEETMFETVKSLLEMKDLKQEWAKRKDKMLKEKIDLTAWILNLLDNYSEIMAAKKNTY